MNKKETIRYSFLASLPVMAGYIVLGIGFGVLLQDKGYAWWWAGLMSLTIYAGSMQYVAVDLLSGGATLIAAAMMTFMVNVRHLFYGITMLDRYSKTGKKKPYLIFALTDETFSLVCSPQLPKEVEEHSYYLLVSLFNQCYWITGSIIGAIAGSLLNFNSEGIDFAMTALFVVIFVSQWEQTKEHIPALTGLIVTICFLLIFGPGNYWFIIWSMIGITAAMFAFRSRLENKTKETVEEKQ